MKNILSYTTIISFAMLLLYSCGPSAADKESARLRRSKTPNAITWDTILVNKSQSLDSKTINASASFEMSFIVPKEYEKKEILDKIQTELNFAVIGEDTYNSLSPHEAANKYVTNYLDNYKKESKSQLALWNKMNGGSKYFSYNNKVETKVLYNEANFISYQVKTIETKGDSTETTTVRNLLFDLTNGELVRENDIYEKDFREKLNKIIIAHILKDSKAENIEELQNLGYWGVADLAANNNFYVDKDGITYTFNPDEYSEAELGVLKVFVDYDEIMDIAKDGCPLSILIHDL